jgi:hypothetical protein
MSPQRGDRGLIRKGLGKLHHAAQVLLFEAAAVFRRQLSRQRGDNLLAVIGTPRSEQVLVDALPDAPIQHRQAHVDSHGDALPRQPDHVADIGKQPVRCL